MALGAVTGFWLVSLLLVLVPGADWAYAITAGLRDRTVMPAVAGLLSGYVILAAVVAAGVAALVARWPLLLTALTVLGSLYLLWLGISTLSHRAAPVAATDEGDRSWMRRAARGAGISGLNPKALLLFLALLPQFITKGGAVPFAAQIMLLGLVHTANCGVVYTGVGTAARKVLKARPAVAVLVTRFSGTAMIIIGLLLLAERLLR
jgi:threonine/homoserine/homoserine lactone efflux protein